jgi:5-methylcytosine-specific restriction protein B
MAAYWFVVVRPENWKADKAGKFSVRGFPSSAHIQAGRLRPGDKLVIYISQVSKIGAICEVESDLYVDDSATSWDDLYPLRVRARPDIVLPEAHRLAFRDILVRLDFVKKKSQWRHYVRRSLQPLSQQDYHVIRLSVEEQAARARRETK